MIFGKLIRRMLALVAAGALGMVAMPQPAGATTAVLHATVDCLNVDYYGDTRDWYPSYLQVNTSPPAASTPVPNSSLVAVPATHAFQFTQALPSGATSMGVAALCSGGHQYGDYYGYANSVTSIPPGTTTITASWRCSTGPVNPGPWTTTCTLQSASFS